MAPNHTQFAVADSCTAFADWTIGVKVLAHEQFFALLDTALAQHDTSQDYVPGQHHIVLPPEAATIVSAGIGRRTQHPDAYAFHTHRGREGAYLKREFAGQTERVTVRIYTREAYLADPDVQANPGETARTRESLATHVVVSVIASTGLFRVAFAAPCDVVAD